MPNLVNDFEVRKETLRALGGNPDGLANIFEVDKEILKLLSEGGVGIDWDTIKQKLAEDGVESIKFTMGNEQVILTASELKTLLNQPVIPEGKYMTITADESNTGETIIAPTVTGSLPNLNLQYRINNGDWSDFIVGTTADIHAAAGDVVQFKGNNTSGISTSTSNYLNFAISGLCHLSGNVMSLIDGVGETLVIPNDYCFYRLFFNSNVKTVSKDFLPAITLTNSCYEKMFRECKNLTNAPELPATTLSSGCYNELFIECPNLKQAPELPATTLEYNCYHGMFQGCSNLVKAPEILPATTLAEHCYESMFSGCINLTKAPVLPAKTLVNSCYYFMFDSCRNLNGVKSLAVEGLNNSSALGSWLNSVASSGTFEKPYGVVYPTGSIPTGWTVKDVDLYIEAPMDGNQYARQNGAWTPVESVEPGIPDAPSDSKTYGRNNGAWTPVESGYPIKGGVEIDNNVVSVQNYGIYTKLNGNFISYESGNNHVRFFDKLEVMIDGEKSEAKFIDVANAGNGVVKTSNGGKVKFWLGTQQEYDAIATKDMNTLYVIK